MNPKKIGEILAKLRKETGKTIAQVAGDINISPSALSMYENGERVPRDAIKIRLAEYYGQSIAIFYAQNTHEM